MWVSWPYILFCVCDPPFNLRVKKSFPPFASLRDRMASKQTPNFVQLIILCRMTAVVDYHYWIQRLGWFCLKVTGFKVQIFWEGHKILWNLHQLFVLCTASQIIGGKILWPSQKIWTKSFFYGSKYRGPKIARHSNLSSSLYLTIAESLIFNLGQISI